MKYNLPYGMHYLHPDFNYSWKMELCFYRVRETLIYELFSAVKQEKEKWWWKKPAHVFVLSTIKKSILIVHVHIMSWIEPV